MSPDDAVLADAFRRLVQHLDERRDVQNIDLMNLAGFCRNCLAKWVQESSASRGEVLDKESVREWLYGMPYEEWKTRFQKT